MVSAMEKRMLLNFSSPKEGRGVKKKKLNSCFTNVITVHKE